MMVTIQEFTTQDKSDWGEGDWQNEPDKIQMLDEETGLDCLIVRNNFGSLCGYVGVPKWHPMYGETKENFEVHGGVTFYGRSQKNYPQAPDRDVVTSGVYIPEKNVWWFGFGSVIVQFIVKGSLGAVDWSMDTGWYLPLNQKELEINTRGGDWNPFKPASRTRGYHSPKPMYHRQLSREGCPLVEGGVCYSDVSYLNGDYLLPLFLREGIDALWSELEKYYKEKFEHDNPI